MLGTVHGQFIFPAPMALLELHAAAAGAKIVSSGFLHRISLKT
jgi:hypothetical protein